LYDGCAAGFLLFPLFLLFGLDFLFGLAFFFGLAFLFGLAARAGLFAGLFLGLFFGLLLGLAARAGLAVLETMIAKVVPQFKASTKRMNRSPKKLAPFIRFERIQAISNASRFDYGEWFEPFSRLAGN
jgi:hypothetical protein